MDKVKLEMEFLDQGDKKFTLRMDNPRADLTDEEVAAAMQNILTQNIFLSGNLDLASANEARIVTTSVNTLAI